MHEFGTLIPHSLLKSDLGDLGIIEFSNLPFIPARTYWLTNVSEDKSRGHHAHKTLRQYLVMLRGSVDLLLHNGRSTFRQTLHADGNGMLLTSGLWREIHKFSNDAVLLVVCDQPYREEDYIRDFDDFIKWVEFND